MNIVFATVGTSALSNKNIGIDWSGKPDGRLVGAIKSYQGDPFKDPDDDNWKDLQKNLVKFHRSVFQSGRPWGKEHHTRTSAELSSTIYLLQHEGIGTVAEVVYLASQSEESKLAARVNAEVLASLRPNLKVTHGFVPGLEAHFIEIRKVLGEMVSRLNPHNLQVIFNITGGFKGAIPSITDLAREKGWTLFYQHESHESGMAFQYPGPTPGPPIKEEEWLVPAQR
jgi:hypothetical protein